MEIISSKEFGYRSTLNDLMKVGDKTSFKPNLSLSRFGGDSRLDIIPQVLGDFSLTLSGDVITLSSSAFGFGFKPTPVEAGFSQFGGLDFEIVLKKRPPVNYISFGYIPTKLTPYHQPALTAQEIAMGARRPDHVVNSIVWNHPTKGGLVTPDDVAKGITTGKAFHLYRMKLVDFLGNWTWANWTLESAGEIRLWADSAFLATAVYPITIKPLGDTFGYTSIGGTGASITENYILSHGDSYLAIAGTGNSMTMYGIRSSAINAQMALYDTATPSALITNAKTGSVAVPAVAGWFTANFTIEPTLTAIQVYLVFNFSGATGSAYYDATGTNNYWYAAQTFGTWPATVTRTSGGSKYQWSIYCTVTPGAAFIPQIIMM